MDDGSKMRRRRRRRRMSLLLSLGIVAGVLVLGCGGFGAFIYIVYIHGTEETVTAADRDMVITAERLARYAPGANWDFSQGTINKVRHLDGSRELTYEYTTPDEAPKPLYISCTVVIEPKLEDARVSYTGLSVGTQIGFKLQRESELKEVERNDLWKWGDESRCVLLTSNGSPVGNVFQARKGRRLFHILIVGVYFQDPAAIRELLAPIVQRLDSYNG